MSEDTSTGETLPLSTDDLRRTAESLRAVLDAIRCGELEASTVERERITGALSALEGMLP